jgi:hypothetical protein
MNEFNVTKKDLRKALNVFFVPGPAGLLAGDYMLPHFFYFSNALAQVGRPASLDRFNTFGRYYILPFENSD